MGDEQRLDEALLRALGSEVLRISGRRTLAPHGASLEGSAFRIIWRLEEHGPLTLRELADDLQLDLSTINRQVRQAVARGHLERYAVEGESSLRVRATEAGRTAYSADGRLRAQLLTRAIDRLGERRTREMVESLRAFNDAVDTAYDEAQVDQTPH